ncbi:hypothetical protein TRIP_C21092 [Candidatus Zixiibacteriota bacterium]|nr:hypothetical protein TRIP_C21092 [candidate division Zixibacteria bacterium]
MQFRIYKLDSSRREDFFRLHSEHNAAEECFCTTWWVPTWEEWAEQTAEQNRDLRLRLLNDGIFDGYLLYDGEEPIGWCQCCPRDLLPKIRQTYNLSPDENIWAICCFFILPRYREIGLAHYFLNEIIQSLKIQGVSHIQSFPKRGRELTPEDVWTGPEAIFLRAGFKPERDDEIHPVFGLDINNKGGT